MTCERREPELALYVEGDLERDQAGALELHLVDCPRCTEFLDELQASQALLRGRATDMLDERALSAVRLGVREALVAGGPGPWQGLASWRWVLAGSLILGAVGARVQWRAHTDNPPPAPRSTVAVVTAAPTSASAADAPEANPASGHEPVAVALAGVARPQGRAARRDSAYGLDAEDADQLARAAVALSRLERVPTGSEFEGEPERPGTPPLMRLATADPDVVIYWQLNSDGG